MRVEEVDVVVGVKTDARDPFETVRASLSALSGGRSRTSKNIVVVFDTQVLVPRSSFFTSPSICP